MFEHICQNTAILPSLSNTTHTVVLSHHCIFYLSQCYASLMAKVKSHLCCRVFPDNQPSLVIPSSELLLQLLHLTYDPLDYSWSSKGHIYFYGPSVIFLKVRITLYMSLYTRPSAYITWLSQQTHHFSVMLISHLFPPSAYLLFFFFIFLL